MSTTYIVLLIVVCVLLHVLMHAGHRAGDGHGGHKPRWRNRRDRDHA